ncbi:3-keto-disaccharide hydrolase [Chryseolinea serpens]|nr:DUF1080 domain-containing protein [Chryseolinea serpens]
MKNIIRVFLMVLVAGTFSSFIDAPHRDLMTAGVQDKWTELFDGKTLKGWHALPGGTWTVEEGTIVGRSPVTEQRHGLLVSDRTYKDFVLDVTFKSIRGNSGIYFRTDVVGGIEGVRGFQAEVHPTDDIGGLYETNGRAWVVKPTADQVSRYYKPNAWNTMRITAKGRDITVTVNGIVSAELKNDPGNASGNIALQLHGGQDMLVMFKNVRIREL